MTSAQINTFSNHNINNNATVASNYLLESIDGIVPVARMIGLKIWTSLVAMSFNSILLSTLNCNSLQHNTLLFYHPRTYLDILLFSYHNFLSLKTFMIQDQSQDHSNHFYRSHINRNCFYCKCKVKLTAYGQLRTSIRSKMEMLAAKALWNLRGKGEVLTFKYP